MNTNQFENSRISEGTLSRGAQHVGAATDTITPEIKECIDQLKQKIPVADQGALDSRAQALINDPETSSGDVVSILRQEFDSAASERQPKTTLNVPGRADR